MKVGMFEERDSKRWDEFVRGSRSAGLYHLSAWKGVIERCFGHRSHYLYAEEDGAVAGVLPMVHLRSRLFGSFMVSMPYFNYGGIAAQSREARDALLERAVEIARGAGAEHMELRDSAPEETGLPVKTTKVSMRLPLPSTTEALKGSLPSKLRSQIRRPVKEKMYSRCGRAELLDDFYAVFSVNMRDLGTPVYPLSFFRAIMESFPEATWICTVYTKEGEPAASGFLAGFKGMMEIPWASSLKRFNSSSPNMLMYWSALELSVREGFGCFDFGRSSMDSGTYRFKKQWGAEPVQLYWHYWLRSGGELPEINPQNPRFRTFIGLWKSMPVWLTRVIGPQIVKNLP